MDVNFVNGVSGADFQAYIDASNIEGDLQQLLNDLDAKSINSGNLQKDLSDLLGDMNRLKRFVVGNPDFTKNQQQLCENLLSELDGLSKMTPQELIDNREEVNSTVFGAIDLVIPAFDKSIGE